MAGVVMARIRPRPAIDWDCVSEDNTVLHQQPSLPNPPPPPRAGSGPPAGGGSTTWRSGTPLPAPLRQQDDEVVANRPGSYCPATFPPVAASHLLVPAFIVCHHLPLHHTPHGPRRRNTGCRSRVSGTRQAARRGIHALQGATVSRIP